MSVFSRYGFIFLILLVLFPVNVRASRLFDAAAVVTMRGGLPCFSYPQDEEIRKLPYSFAYISVTRPGPIASKDGWAAQIADPYNTKGLLEPNSPKTCIKYGGPHAGIKDTDPATPFLMDTPYYVFIRVGTLEGPLYERKFLSNFCLTRDGKGNKIIVGAQYDDNSDEWKCLKPGEMPKKGFWKRLFGK